MIDIEKTISLRGYDPLMLSHGSNKIVWCICNKCGVGRWSDFKQYRDLCHSCKMGDPIECELRSKIRIEYFKNNPEAGNDHSLRLVRYWSDKGNRDVQSRKLSKYWEDQDRRNEQSIKMKNSDNHKAIMDNQRGGTDIVNHHYLYDHSDLSKNTVQMIRSDHSRLHWLLWKLGVDVPHINM